MRAVVLSILILAALTASSGAARAGNTTAGELDLAALRVRLEETRALGFLAKLELRGRVHELVETARTLATPDHEAQQRLRARYDALLDQLIGLLAGEPELHRALRSAREPIWRELLHESPPGEQAAAEPASERAAKRLARARSAQAGPSESPARAR